MREVGMNQARKELTQLVDDVRMTGEPILVKDRNRPMVVISPVAPATEEGAGDASGR